MILTPLCTWIPAIGTGLCYLKSKRENVTPDPNYVSGSKSCQLPEGGHPTPRFRVDKRKSNHQVPKFYPGFRNGNHQLPRFSWPIREKVQNHQTPRFRVDNRKSNHQVPKFNPGFRNGNHQLPRFSWPIKEKVQNHQTPRFRLDKRKSNHQIPKFHPGFRNGNHQIPRFRADKRKCKNNDEYCEQWSKLGDCDHKVYGPYMKKYCKLSCNLCTR